MTAPDTRPGTGPAGAGPVARVLVDTGLAHLDRPFDYAVPAEFDEDARPGVRVKVRFAGRDRDGFLLERADTSDAGRALAPLRRVVSAEQVLTPEIARLCGEVAARYAGRTFDVVRQAVPPRHARVEQEHRRPPPPGAPAPVHPDGWRAYDGGDRLVAAAAGGGTGIASVSLLPDRGAAWPRLLAALAAAAAGRGGGSVVVVPDHRDLARLEAACADRLGAEAFVAMSADLGPAERYRRFLAVLRGHVRVVIGTRAAVFAPVHDLALVCCYDDGDDLHTEPRAPGWNVRDVLLRRAHDAGALAVLAGYATSTERQALVEQGWAFPVAAPREGVRAAAPRVTVAGATERQRERDPLAATARVPREAGEVVRAALAAGAPVLVQVPRRGYALAVACAHCHTRVECARCGGPIAARGSQPGLHCGWCGTAVGSFTCGECGGTSLRAPVLGSERTAEELGRAFPGVAVRTSAGDTVLARVAGEPALVIATPGAEPVADGGYGAALLLDGLLLVSRADLRAEEEALRRWMAAAALVRPAADGGRVLLVAPPQSRASQALVGWDPGTFAARELAERRDSHLPPAARLAVLDGAVPVLEGLVAQLTDAGLPPGAEVLGPVALDPGPGGGGDADPVQARLIVRVPPRSGRALATALARQQARRSAAKEDGTVRIRLDPVPLA